VDRRPRPLHRSRRGTETAGRRANLFDTHPAGKGWIFQIDGNFGAVEGIVKILVQCHEEEISFPSALPKAWPGGRVCGLRARGVVEEDLEWKRGRADSAFLQASPTREHKLRALKGQRIAQL